MTTIPLRSEEAEAGLVRTPQPASSRTIGLEVGTASKMCPQTILWGQVHCKSGALRGTQACSLCSVSRLARVAPPWALLPAGAPVILMHHSDRSNIHVSELSHLPGSLLSQLAMQMDAGFPSDPMLT